MTSPSVNDQEQKPSSLEELREKVEEILMFVCHAGSMAQAGKTINPSMFSEQAEEIMQLFRSHMQAAFEEVIKGPRNSWVQYDKKNDNFAHGFAIAQKMIEERAKQYLQGDKTNHE